MAVQKPAAAPEITAYVALGSNLGDREARLDAALAALDATSGVRVLRASSRHETAPVGGPPQPAFLNAAVAVATTLSPQALLARLHAIEAAAGRVRGPVRDAPRTLDLDLLLHGDAVIDTPELALPHPRMHERLFVLLPLREIAPALRHPLTGASVVEMVEELDPSPTTCPGYTGGGLR